MSRRLTWLAVVFLMLVAPSAAGTAAFSTPAAGTLRNPARAALWSGTVDGTATPSAAVPECQLTPCDRFDLAVALSEGTWEDKPGGVQVAIRWSGLAGDNLRLYVYRAGARVASSDGIISTAQALLIPAAPNGLYTVYVAYDPDSLSPVINYDGFARVQYAPRAEPLRPLRPDLVARPQRNVTFETPPPIFFDLPPGPGSSCFPSEISEDGAETCLRFDQVFANRGEGPLELRFALPHDPSVTEHDVLQRTFWSDDASHYTDAPAGEWEFHLAHNHYHSFGFALSRLWASNAGGARLGSVPIRIGHKIGFCVADVEIDAWAQKGVGPRTYNAPDCLFPASSDADFDYLVQGITPGWADIYDWYLPGQYIEVSGVPDGYYLLETVADPDNGIVEADETNNCASVLIQLSNIGTDSPTARLITAGAPC